jgi:hypothetical protein
MTVLHDTVYMTLTEFHEIREVRTDEVVTHCMSNLPNVFVKSQQMGVWRCFRFENTELVNRLVAISDPPMQPAGTPIQVSLTKHIAMFIGRLLASRI